MHPHKGRYLHNESSFFGFRRIFSFKLPKSNLSEVGGNFEARELGLVSFFLIWTHEMAPGCPGKNSKFSSYPTPLVPGDKYTVLFLLIVYDSLLACCPA